MKRQPHDPSPQPSLELPELLDKPTARPRWQFGLWYLLLLTTVAAAVAGVVRYLSEMPPLAIGMAVYFLGIAIYFVVRIPWVMALLSPERDRIRENRRRLTAWADQQRKEKSEP